MAQSNPDLIDRRELLRVIRDHAAKIKDDDPLQHAALTYWAAVVEALPAVDAVPVPAQAWQAAMDYLRRMHPCTECRYMGDMDQVLAECLAAQCVCADCLNVDCPCHFCTEENGEKWEWRYDHEQAE